MTKPAEAARPPAVYLTPRELAARLRMTEKALANWRCERRGPPFHKLGSVGRGARVLYALVDVVAWEASQRQACESGGNR